MNSYSFDREDNASYYSDNENNFKNPIINPENYIDLDCNDKTKF